MKSDSDVNKTSNTKHEWESTAVNRCTMLTGGANRYISCGTTLLFDRYLCRLFICICVFLRGRYKQANYRKQDVAFRKYGSFLKLSKVYRQRTGVARGKYQYVLTLDISQTE